MIELIYGEEIVKELTNQDEIFALLKPCLNQTKFMDDKNGEVGVFDRLEQERDSVSVGSKHVGPYGHSYYWNVDDESGRYKSYITKEGNNLWFRFDIKEHWRIQLTSGKMEKSCLICSSKCKKDKPCELYDGLKLVI